MKIEEEIITLLLERDALAMFIEMREKEKKFPKKIKDRIRDTLGENPFMAFRRLISMKWNGEPADVFLINLRKTARAAGVCGDVLLKRGFVWGFPEHISKVLRGTAKIETCNIDAVLSRV